MQYIDAVNRILRTSGIIRGDTDALSTFNDTEHNATSNIAQIAIQAEISELIADQRIPYEKVMDATLSMISAQRNYAFPTNFTTMWGDPPFFFDKSRNNHIFEYPGGEDQLRRDIYTYETDKGYPVWFYFMGGTVQQIGFYPVPDASTAGTLMYYDYNSDVNVVNSSDTIPLITLNQQYAFCDMAARRFALIFEGDADSPIEQDAIWKSAKSRLLKQLVNRQPSRSYGKVYRS